MKLKIFLFTVLSVSFASLSAVEMKIIDGPCSCYKEKSGREWPINDVAKAWKSLQGDSAACTTKRMVPNEELFEYKEEYNTAAEAAYQTSVSLVKALRNLRLANEPSYYPSDFERLFDALNQINNHLEKWNIYERTFIHDRRLCTNGLTGRCFRPSKYYDEEINLFKRAANSNRERWIRKQKELQVLFEKVNEICKKTHINLLSLYEEGYSLLKNGKYYNALQAIKQLIQHAKSVNKTEYLSAQTYLTMGFVSSLSHEYAQTINILSEVIDKDPTNYPAYIERAIAYFEQGNFDLAIKDYITSGKGSLLKIPSDPYKLQFGKGLAHGAYSGMSQSIQELPASILHSLHGMGQLLWAGVTTPVETCENIVDAANNAIDYLLTQDLAQISNDIAPELSDLLAKWHTLDSKTRGEKTGYLLGKYGINILTCYGGAKSVQLFKELREANALCNLKSLAANPEILASAASEAAAARAQFFQKVGIHADKQGKHIVGHKNYDATLQKSILTHADPERLLLEKAGKGIPLAQFTSGTGYKEVVEFGEMIGEYFDQKTMQFLPTTRAKIHYGKDGRAHIVPAPPKSPGGGL